MIFRVHHGINCNYSVPLFNREDREGSEENAKICLLKIFAFSSLPSRSSRLYTPRDKSRQKKKKGKKRLILN